MKPEVNFYQVDEAPIKSVAPLLLKILDEGKKALVFCANQKQISDIDAALWNYGRNKFIPHATVFDKEFSSERQPVLISNREENLNNADYLVFFDVPNDDFLAKFPRIFHFFESHNHSQVQDLTGRISSKASKINSYQKKDGKWIKF